MRIRQRLALLLLTALGVADCRTLLVAPACTPYSRIAGFCVDANLTGAGEGDTMSLDARATTVTFDWLSQARLPPATHDRSHTQPGLSRRTLLRARRWPVALHALTSPAVHARVQVNSTLLPNATAASTAVRSICNLDGVPVPDCTLPHNTSRLLPGVHTFAATYLDPVTLQVRDERRGSPPLLAHPHS